MSEEVEIENRKTRVSEEVEIEARKTLDAETAKAFEHWLAKLPFARREQERRRVYGW